MLCFLTSCHKHEYIEYSSKAATCEADGNINYFECMCGKYFIKENEIYRECNYEDTIIKKLGHNIVIDEKIDPTCTKNGISEGCH